MPVWGWALAAIAGAYLAYRLYRSRTSSGSPSTVDSGTPGPGQWGADTATSPGGASGGGASVPGQLPATLVTQPDTLQQQVQAADTTSAEVPTAQQTPLYTDVVATPTSTAPEIPVPSLPAYAPIPGTASHQVAPGTVAAPILNTPVGSNIHRPGVQL